MDLTGADGETLNILATVKDKRSAVCSKIDECKFREKELNRRLDDYKYKVSAAEKELSELLIKKQWHMSKLRQLETIIEEGESTA